jgi:hypothetical protein
VEGRVERSQYSPRRDIPNQEEMQMIDANAFFDFLI